MLYAKKMIPAGYLLKDVLLRPDWIKAECVKGIYSVSSCISKDFSDYIKFWKHNGYWFFNSPEILRDLANNEGIDVSDMTLFYYEVYQSEYNDETGAWSLFSADLSLATNVIEVQNKKLVGFDVTTFSQRNSAECSPLSCCSLATEISVNEHCLFETFEEAKRSLEAGKFCNSEPGPFRIIAVYKIDAWQTAKH